MAMTPLGPSKEKKKRKKKKKKPGETNKPNLKGVESQNSLGGGKYCWPKGGPIGNLGGTGIIG